MWSSPQKGYVVCVSNPGYAASLEVRKLYVFLDPLPNDPVSFVRVVDESGEDYLYPKGFFRVISLPAPLRQVLAQTVLTG